MFRRAVVLVVALIVVDCRGTFSKEMWSCLSRKRVNPPQNSL
jgi:hypothetical protein